MISGKISKVAMAGLVGASLISIALASHMSKKEKMLHFIGGLQGRVDRRLLWGQHMNVGKNFSSLQETFDEFGVWPAFGGGDYWEAGNTYGHSGEINWQDVNASLIRFSDMGGWVTLNAYFGAPGFPRSWNSKRERNVDFDALMDKSSAVYADFIDMLSITADGLEELKDHGVVVLFRWLGEMSGGWFWWGQRTPEQFRFLWIEAYDYLVRVRKLDNLIWIFCPNGTTSLTQPDVMMYYPGDNYVDLVALDFYKEDHTIMRRSDVDSLLSTGKPFGFGEMGWTTTYPEGSNDTFDNREYLNAIKQKFPETVFFQSWSGTNAVRNQLYGQELLADPLIITLDELPKF